jgi:conflict system STAND superfamily ATPase/TIR domain-containing protein
LPRLFISHSSKDNVQALAFQNWLAANGWPREDVFIDLHGIGAGERWRETLRKANHQCEAVVLLASPDSLESKECAREMNLAEDQGKEIVIALLRDLTKDDPRLARYSERQFVDLSQEPTDRLEPFEFEGRLHRVEFNAEALASIKVRLSDLGIAPGSFGWPPKGAVEPEPYPGLAAFGEEDAGIFFGRDADIMAALTEIRLVRRRRAPRMVVIDAASGAGKSSFLRAGLWPRLKRDPDFAPLGILRPAQGIITGPDGVGRRLAPFFEHFNRPKAPGAIHASLMVPDLAAAGQALTALVAEAAQLTTDARRAAAPEARAPASLIAIDQGEELFSAENDVESRRLLSLLAPLLKAPPEGVDPYILITIRADSVQSLLNRIAELGRVVS